MKKLISILWRLQIYSQFCTRLLAFFFKKKLDVILKQNVVFLFIPGKACAAHTGCKKGGGGRWCICAKRSIKSTPPGENGRRSLKRKICLPLPLRPLEKRHFAISPPKDYFPSILVCLILFCSMMPLFCWCQNSANGKKGC